MKIADLTVLSPELMSCLAPLISAGFVITGASRDDTSPNETDISLSYRDVDVIVSIYKKWTIGIKIKSPLDGMYFRADPEWKAIPLYHGIRMIMMKVKIIAKWGAVYSTLKEILDENDIRTGLYSKSNNQLILLGSPSLPEFACVRTIGGTVIFTSPKIGRTRNKKTMSVDEFLSTPSIRIVDMMLKLKMFDRIKK